MPWKEPGKKSSGPREPWGGDRHGGGPALDAWLRQRLGKLGPFGRSPLGPLALIVVLVILWFLIGGWTVVGAQQVGVVLRLGRLDRVLQPGLHLHLPAPLAHVIKVDLGRVHEVGDQARLMTRDGELAQVDYAVGYKVTDARKFLFAARDAAAIVRNAATSSARAAVGAQELRCLIAALARSCTGGAIGPDRLAAGIRARLDSAGTPFAAMGVAIDSVKVTSIGVPSDVQSAFDAITKAGDGATTAKAEATADVARGKATAAGQAAAARAGADAYKREAIADADAAVARFDAVLGQYQAAPQVTRHRLWLDAMQAVLTKNRVVVNTGSGNVVVQFAEPRPAAASSVAPTSATTHLLPAPSASAAPPVTSGPAVKGVGK